MTTNDRRLTLLELASGKCPFEEWYKSLREKKARQIIWKKITQLQNPTFEAFKSVGGGVFELRIFFGPGYRIYFGLEGSDVIVLIAGGDKSSQDRDIETARSLWKEYLNEAKKRK